MVGSFQKAEKIVPLIRSSISGPTRQNAPRSRKRTRCFPQVRPPSMLLCTRTSVSWPKSVMLSHRRWQTATTVPRLVASSPGSRTPKPFPGVEDRRLLRRTVVPTRPDSDPGNRRMDLPRRNDRPYSQRPSRNHVDASWDSRPPFAVAAQVYYERGKRKEETGKSEEKGFVLPDASRLGALLPS